MRESHQDIYFMFCVCASQSFYLSTHNQGLSIGLQYDGVLAPYGIVRMKVMGSCEFQKGTADCCPWDLDGTGFVGISDLLEFFTQLGTAGSADFDESGIVDTADHENNKNKCCRIHNERGILYFLFTG